MKRTLYLSVFLSGFSYANPNIQQESAISQLQELERDTDNNLAPRVSPIKQTQVKSIKNADKIMFVFKGVVLEGKSPLSQAEMLATFADYKHKKISVSMFQKLVNRLNSKFMAAGYILTRAYIPHQKAKNGVIKVAIAAGHFTGYDVMGNPPKSMREKIDHLIKPVLKEKPVNIKTLEHALLVLNQIPGFSVKSVISPNKKQKHAVHLTLITKSLATHLSAFSDNYLNRLDGSARLTANFDNYDVFPGSMLGLRISQTINPEVSNYMVATSKFPLGKNGDYLGLKYTTIKNSPNYSVLNPALASSQSAANSKTWQLSVTHPMQQTRLYSQDIFFDLNKITSNLDNSVFGNDFEDRISTMRLGSSWNFIGPKFSKARMTLSWTHGLGSAFGAGYETPSRENGELVFDKFNLNLTSIKNINSIMQAEMHVYAQTSYNILLSAEEFAVGGRYCGIGYDSSELVGDDGYCVHKQLNIALPSPRKFGINNWHAFAFHDNGLIRNKSHDTSTQSKKDKASSVGMGIAMKFSHNLAGKLLYALPLDHDIGLESDKKQRGRVFFNISYSE